MTYFLSSLQTLLYTSKDDIRIWCRYSYLVHDYTIFRSGRRCIYGTRWPGNTTGRNGSPTSWRSWRRASTSSSRTTRATTRIRWPPTTPSLPTLFRYRYKMMVRSLWLHSVADPGCLSWILIFIDRIPDPDLYRSDPGSKNSTKRGGGGNFFGPTILCSLRNIIKLKI